MAEYTIDKIEYGGNIYHLQDANTSIAATEEEVNISGQTASDTNIYRLYLSVGSLENADIRDY